MTRRARIEPIARGQRLKNLMSNERPGLAPGTRRLLLEEEAYAASRQQRTS
jgi:hypothetical protein